MNKQRVLVYDIETKPFIACVFDRRDQNIGTNQILSDWCVLAWAAKWLDDPASKVMYMDQRHAKDVENDKAILQPLWKLLDKADIVVTQNGKNFDSPKLNARFITHGMQPPSVYKHLDTYQIVRRAAKFTSNGLDYLTGKLCTKYKKLSHSKYPGMELWKACLAGNMDAWNEMKKYNIHDVLATEELYNKIKAWAPENAPHVYNVVDKSRQCSTCGTLGRMNHNGVRTTKRGVFKRYRCTACGSWQQDDVKMK